MITYFFDLDGVLANFYHGIGETFGRQPNEMPLGVYDISQVFGLGFPDIVRHLNSLPNFWEELNPYPWVPWIKEVLFTAMKVENVYILTTPFVGDVWCKAGKVKWVKRHLGIAEERIIFAHDKYFLSAPNRILIDDLPRHVNNWRVFGGHAVLFPSHHNVFSAKFDLGTLLDPRSYLVKELHLTQVSLQNLSFYGQN